ncbi:hypothetical protein [Labilithrix luteola]|nr:hypothetical protein [Labilithrix luteola]
MAQKNPKALVPCCTVHSYQTVAGLARLWGAAIRKASAMAEAEV